MNATTNSTLVKAIWFKMRKEEEGEDEEGEDQLWFENVANAMLHFLFVFSFMIKHSCFILSEQHRNA